MKLKQLESILSTVNYKFETPRIELEQYPTSPHLAASVCLAAYGRGDLGPEVAVADLGCGTGMLTLASACLDCYQIIAVDVDEDALEQARQNALEMEVDHIVDFIHAELQFSPSSTTISHHLTNKRGGGKQKSKLHNIHSSYEPKTDGIPLIDSCVDTVLINPPFGTKHNAGIDVGFLAAGCRLARTCVYSFHKSSTRAHLQKKAIEWNMGFEVVAEMKFDIQNSYKFHKQKCVDVEVDLIRLHHLT